MTPRFGRDTMGIGGILTAMVTPFGQDGRLDEDAAVRLMRHLLYNGSDGLVLAAVATLLASESKSLLIGEPADKHLTESLLALASGVPGVVRMNSALTSHLSPDQIVVSLSLEFEDQLRVPEIEAAVRDIEQRVRGQFPEITALFIKPQSPPPLHDARTGG